MQDHDHQGRHHHGADEEFDPQQLDAATRSLSDALRLSFRVLTVLMILLLIGFLLSGFKTIDTQDVGVKKVFGKVTGQAQSGFAFNWPWPVGEIELVRVSERSMQIDDFWVFETASDKANRTPLSERRPPGEGLKPGFDGALLAGDRNLIHARINCKYRVQQPEAYLRHVVVDTQSPRRDDQALREIVRSAVVTAAIHTAAEQTAQSIKRDPGTFAVRVRDLAQRQLGRIIPSSTGEAVVINRLEISPDWPIRVQPAYANAQRANSQAEAMRNQAVREARAILGQAAGGNFHMLVGTPWQTQSGDEAQINLIGQYAAAREELRAARDALAQAGSDKQASQARQAIARSEQRADELLARIDDVLASHATGGEASGVIAQAESYAASLVQGVRGRAESFRGVLAEYNRAPQLMIERLWADTKDEILSSPMVEPLYVTTAENGKTFIKISRDPAVVREITRQHYQMQDESQRQQRN